MTAAEFLTKYQHSGVFVGMTDDERLASLSNETFGTLTDVATEIAEDADGAKYTATGDNIYGIRVKRIMRVTDDGFMWRYAEGMVAR